MNKSIYKSNNIQKNKNKDNFFLEYKIKTLIDYEFKDIIFYKTKQKYTDTEYTWKKVNYTPQTPILQEPTLQPVHKLFE